MAKFKTTKRAIKTCYNGKVLSVSYCGLQHLLSTTQPFAYSTRTEGWACDYYAIGDGYCISTGYAPIGKAIGYDLCHKYDEKARAICDATYDYVKRKAQMEPLIAEFIIEVKNK